jgi:hypothetical protein
MTDPQKIRNWTAKEYIKAFSNNPSGPKVIYEKQRGRVASTPVLGSRGLM